MPATVPLDVYRGDDHHWTQTLPDEDLTDTVVKAEIRAVSAGKVLATLTAAVTLPNVVDLALPASESAKLPAGRLKWDLQATSPAGKRTLLAGPVTVTADVTDSDDPEVNPL